MSSKVARLRYAQFVAILLGFHAFMIMLYVAYAVQIMLIVMLVVINTLAEMNTQFHFSGRCRKR